MAKIESKAAALEDVKVQIQLPLLPDDDSGVAVDQYEHVTINGKTTLIKRGEVVDVSVPVFEQLKNKFPKL